jgi:tRNA(fMet)-specific endonuclease VapC
VNAGLLYLLDTNILSSLAKEPEGPVGRHLRIVGDGSVCTSVIVACEIRFGLAKGGSPALRERLHRILAALEILPLESDVESHYADIRWFLERKGTPIGPNDLLIAAHARSLGLSVVSHNLAEFQRVPGLIAENWLEE